jgi:NAD(P)-dependent dehydrogenase (short-subunit alcohol dehydrogenase family)
LKFQLPDQLQFMMNERAPQKKSDASLKDRVCIVTGANSGVGFAAAKRLAQGGAHVVMVCRSPERAEAARAEVVKAGPGPVDVVLADLASLDDVRRAAAELLERYPKIHVLINNAGFHSTTRTVTGDGYETVFAVNHLASFLLTRLLLDRLRESAPARIIQVNSQGHRFNGLDVDDIQFENRRYTGMRGYGQSKTAQLMTVWDLAEQLEGTGVTINAMHPGSVHSNIGSNNGALYLWFKRNVTNRMLTDADVSGESIYWLAADPELEGVNGRFFNLTIYEKPAPHALDREVGRRVWKITEELTGLSETANG